MPRIRDYSFNAAAKNEEEIVDKEKESEKIEEETSEVSISAVPKKEMESKISHISVHKQSQKSESGQIEKITKPEKDLTPKYTDAALAIKSIVEDGDYYEDYLRAEGAGLLKDKEFVLTVIAQNYNRFYSPQTPKPSDWIDEEYLTARISYFFEQSKESIKDKENNDLADNIYNFLRKCSFSTEAYGTVSDTFRRVAKVNAARVASPEDSERMKASISRFNDGVNSAIELAKQKHNDSQRDEQLRQETLSSEKKELVSLIDAMKFSF